MTDRVVERFRVKNDLLVSQIDEMDWVEHDESISTTDEDDAVDELSGLNSDIDEDEEGLVVMSDANLEDLDDIEDKLEEEFVMYVFLLRFSFFFFFCLRVVLI